MKAIGSDFFSFERWMDAFKKCGISPEFYAFRTRSTDEILPWDMIDVGVTKKHLLHEKEMAEQSRLSPDCRRQCSGCGAIKLLNGEKCDG